MKDMLSARLRKPDGFKGTPLFADDRAVDPILDPVCQIRPDLTDVSRLTYNLLITDFNRCGVLKRNVSLITIYVLIIYYLIVTRCSACSLTWTWVSLICLLIAKMRRSHLLIIAPEWLYAINNLDWCYFIGAVIELENRILFKLWL